MPKAAETLLYAMYRRGGVRKAMVGGRYLVAWGMCADAIGHRPTQEEYSDYWVQSRATTVREVRAFKACMPGGVGVEDVWSKVSYAVRGAKDREEAAVRVAGARWSL